MYGQSQIAGKTLVMNKSIAPMALRQGNRLAPFIPQIQEQIDAEQRKQTIIKVVKYSAIGLFVVGTMFAIYKVA